MRVITFIPLKCGDDHIALSFELIDLSCEIRKITGCRARLIICCSWEATDIRFVAANKGDLVAIDFEQRRLELIMKIEAATEIWTLIFLIHRNGFQHTRRAAIREVIAGQFDHVGTDIGE